MFFHALAADYDGTIAHHGAVEISTVNALKDLKRAGRRVLLVTGREMADLRHAFPELGLFDRVVAENGAVIYDPATDTEKLLATPPPGKFIQKLIEQGVEPISVGHTIVATWHPHEAAVLAAIEELGLELQIVFNKGAVMVLPTGVNKATGLIAALHELGMSPINVVAVGDAENDHAFLRVCGCSAAVANAIRILREETDIALGGDHGAGVVELIQRIIEEDHLLVPAYRHGILIGDDLDGEPIYVRPEETVLIVGASGSGKSSFATLLTERIAERGQEFCLLDPEGDYENLGHALRIGDRNTAPSLDDAVSLIEKTGENVVINTIGVALDQRPGLLARLFPTILALRKRTGRPHWVVIDEAHHFMARDSCNLTIAGNMRGVLLITVNPRALPLTVLKEFTSILSIGTAAGAIIAELARSLGERAPEFPQPALGEALFWRPQGEGGPRIVTVGSPTQPHCRHGGKYAVGDVGREHSFHFLIDGSRRDARNLTEFLELADLLDDAEWETHLRRGDFTAWFSYVIRDDELARTADAAAAECSLGAHATRARIRCAILNRYRIPSRASRRSAPS